MAQKTLTTAEAKNLASKGIECYVRCTSNKVDQAKEDIRSICLNFDIKGQDADGDIKNIGKGNNLNINNLTPSDYQQLCKLFGVAKIDDGTPLVAVLYHAEDYEQRQTWLKAWAREDKEIPENQTDVTEYSDAEPEGTITKKQLKYINDLSGNLETDPLIADAISGAGVHKVEQLSKEQASDLLKELKKKGKEN